MKKRPHNAQSDSNTTYAGGEELWAVEKHLTNYNQDLISKLTKAQKNAKDVLEFGAGIGTLANLWEQVTGTKPECLEIDLKQRQIIEERGFRCYDCLDSIDKKFDVIYTSNVLEHIEDDLLVLKQLNSKIKDGGSLIIYVPAFQVLYSQLDEKIGHYRRYEKQDLTKKLTEAGFRIKQSCFADSIGFFAWLYLKIKGTSSSESQEQSMKIYDKYIFPISKLFDTLGCKYLFGKNLLIYAQKM